MATTGSTGSERRREHLLSALERDSVIRLSAAAAELGVSNMTIRRDLDRLAEEGLVRRVRGGAVPVVGPRPFAERTAIRQRAKATIAAKALPLVPRSGWVAFDASSTVATLAARIGPRSALSVMTNSYQAFAAMKALPGVTPVLTGGEPERTTDSLVGPIAVAAAESVRYRRFFASARAVDPEFGTSEVSLQEATIKRTFGRMAAEVVLCIDSSKLFQQSTATCVALSAASVMITELEPGDRRLDPFRDLVDLR
jgi:DeoR family fructose operon transcriptional repressor